MVSRSFATYSMVIMCDDKITNKWTALAGGVPCIKGTFVRFAQHFPVWSHACLSSENGAKNVVCCLMFWLQRGLASRVVFVSISLSHRASELH